MSLAVATSVLLLGALFDFYDHRSRLAYMAGVVAATLGYLAGAHLEET